MPMSFYDWYGESGEECVDRPNPKVIAICGRKRSGKSTLTSMICGLDNSFIPLSFAAPLKSSAVEGLSRVLFSLGKGASFAGDTDEAMRQLKLEILGDFESSEPARKERYRPFLQWFGDVLKDAGGEDFFTKKLFLSMNDYPGKNFVISDLRLLREAILLRENYKAFIVKVERGSVPICDDHKTELEVEQIVPDLTVVNDSSLDDLVESAKTILEIMGVNLESQNS